MAWTVTAEVGEFTEAATWLQNRMVLTKVQALELDLDARQRAFWIGGGLQLTQVQRVFDEINKAVKSGEDFATWRKRVRSELRNDAHAETVFRNAVQRAYSAGRWKQMHEPGVIEWRPYFMHDSVLDSRTTETCRKLDGLVLPANDPHWRTHWPPGHHRCRRGVRSLRKAEAERRGIGVAPPIEDAPGFGLAPDQQPVWKPDPKKHDPALVAELEKKSKREPKAKKPKEPPRTHDPKYWEGQLEAQYGAAAPAVAWGRAMYERGLDRSAKEIVAELTRLSEAGVPGFKGARFPELQKLGNKPLRNTASAQEHRGYIALAEHSLSIQRGTFPVLSGPGVSQGTQGTREAAIFYTQLLDKSVARPNSWKLEIDPAVRAFASPSRKTIVLGDGRNTPIAIHEIAHAIEDTDSRAVARSRAFLKSRTKGEPRRHLSELAPERRWEDNEFGWLDEFFDVYVGKDYGERATEVTSMGYQKLAEPFGLEEIAGGGDTSDWDMLHFLLGQLAGR